MSTAVLPCIYNASVSMVRQAVAGSLAFSRALPVVDWYAVAVAAGENASAVASPASVAEPVRLRLAVARAALNRLPPQHVLLALTTSEAQDRQRSFEKFACRWHEVTKWSMNQVPAGPGGSEGR